MWRHRIAPTQCVHNTNGTCSPHIQIQCTCTHTALYLGLCNAHRTLYNMHIAHVPIPIQSVDEKTIWISSTLVRFQEKKKMKIWNAFNVFFLRQQIMLHLLFIFFKRYREILCNQEKGAWIWLKFKTRVELVGIVCFLVFYNRSRPNLLKAFWWWKWKKSLTKLHSILKAKTQDRMTHLKCIFPFFTPLILIVSIISIVIIMVSNILITEWMKKNELD